jgi:hypothetical protein
MNTRTNLLKEKYTCYSESLNLYIAPCTLFTCPTTEDKDKAEIFSGMDNTEFKLIGLKRLSKINDLKFCKI